MSSRRDHPTQTTGAHRAHSALRPNQHQRSGPSKVFSRAGASPKAGANGTAGAATSAVADGPAPPPGAVRTAGAPVGTVAWPEAEGSAGQSTGAAVPSVATVPADAVPGGEPAERGLVRYEPYLDGLFTYCLSVMCEHDAAISAVGEALVIADRQHERDRAPSRRSLHRPWLYALARWVCLRRLAEQNSREGGRDTAPATAAHLTEAARTQRRRDLAALAWPEAAGTTPEQREALELAVRHGLPAHEVAAVLSLSAEAASALLSQAACEVERTRAALAVVKSGGCPAVSGLAGEDQLLLGPAFRRELVKHVDECPHCRRAAERAMSGVAWPGTAPAGTAVLAVLEAPRPAVEAAVLTVRRARHKHMPRFDRTGFPVEIKDRGARRDKLRSRAVTTTVVATVIAAPVLALWAAYRGAPLTGESDGSSVSASERDDEAALRGQPFENAAEDRVRGRDDRGRDGKDDSGKKKAHGKHGKDKSGATAGAGRLSVDARPAGGATLIRLTASGSSPVRWSMSGDASWLVFSRTSGVLRPGETVTVRVGVLRSREPAGAWAAHIRVAPSGALVTIKGRGSGSTSPTPPQNPPSPPPSSEEPTTPPPSEDPTTPPPEDPPSSEDPSSPPD
ncbi:hypothetical protein [Streptomyces sp. WMMB 322]|uniref:hypothetical protein n=1 Tax=Streptomyces sp. WMMB 322 TaxID=1286821 RepID=UPI0008238A20|nr:hypothetical protein [Streptomyces sp. WMMB 322]SCK58374.1 DNA-directed RNA polymerase specialized sigma subunit, sigma24 family [Streptomyces sp. WMMB 322]